MDASSAGFYASAGPMTVVPDHPAVVDIPSGGADLRAVVQGVLVHRDWAAAYGLAQGEVRLAEQHLRSTAAVIDRALELSPQPLGVPRPPAQRVVGICRHFTLLHTAFLRDHGVPARVRCGFSNYFDRTKWYDHWITEWWDGGRWVRDDPQIDELQARTVGLDFDPYDQPPGKFLTGAEAWTATRAGLVDPTLFGIFDMWGPAFIAGNVLSDFACLNKVELLPWDAWGMGMEWGPHDRIPDETATVLDEVAALASSDEVDAIRARYESDDRLRVPPDITSYVDGAPVRVHLELS